MSLIVLSFIKFINSGFSYILFIIAKYFWLLFDFKISKSKPFKIISISINFLRDGFCFNCSSIFSNFILISWFFKLKSFKSKIILCIISKFLNLFLRRFNFIKISSLLFLFISWIFIKSLNSLVISFISIFFIISSNNFKSILSSVFWLNNFFKSLNTFFVSLRIKESFISFDLFLLNISINIFESFNLFISSALLNLLSNWGIILLFSGNLLIGFSFISFSVFCNLLIVSSSSLG